MPVGDAYEPHRQTLNFRHIEQINLLTFNYRELSRQVTTLLGIVPSTVVSQLRCLNDRIMESVESLESDLARNERSTFEAKVDFYQQELLDCSELHQELYEILQGPPTPPIPSQPLVPSSSPTPAP